MTTGSTAWGHSTGVGETNTRTFTGNWTGTGTISGSGDAEVINLNTGEYMQSEIVNMGADTVALKQNFYNTAGDDATLYYRTAASEEAITSETWVLYTGNFTSLGYVQVKLQVGAPLEVSTTNARYFADSSGKPVYLSGFHTWANVQDGDVTYPPATFGWSAYLSALLSYGCNFTELWCHEMIRGWSDTDDVYFLPDRYERTGPGTANDGQDKYDVTKINQDYLDRLRSRAVDCFNNGIYACVMLFDGWCTESKGWAGNPFTYHPYELANNINSLDGDTNNDTEGYEVQYHTGNNALTYEENLVAAILDTLGDLPNVFYNVANESTGSAENTAWQEHMMDYIRTYQTANGLLTQLVGFTKQYPNASSATIKSSSADFGAYDTDYAGAPYDGDGPVSVYDTDHTFGLTDTYAWIWESLCDGHGGAWYMDEWDGVCYGADTRNDATYILIRDNLGYALTLFNLLNNPLLMTPQPSLSSSGFCLARDHATAGEYVCYYDGSSTFTLDLTNATGTLNIRWLRTSDGTVQDSATVSGGDVRTLTPPWTGKVVAYVRHI